MDALGVRSSRTLGGWKLEDGSVMVKEMNVGLSTDPHRSRRCHYVYRWNASRRVVSCRASGQTKSRRWPHIACMHRWHSGTVHIGGDQHGLAYVRFLLIPVQLRAAQRCMYQRGFGFGFGKRFRQRNRDRNHGRSYGNSTSTHAFRPNRERYASLCSTDVDSDSCDWDNGGAESGHDTARHDAPHVLTETDLATERGRHRDCDTDRLSNRKWRVAGGRVVGRARGDKGRLWASTCVGLADWRTQLQSIDARWGCEGSRQSTVWHRVSFRTTTYGGCPCPCPSMSMSNVNRDAGRPDRQSLRVSPATATATRSARQISLVRSTSLFR